MLKIFLVLLNEIFPFYPTHKVCEVARYQFHSTGAPRQTSTNGSSLSVGQQTAEFGL
jgi:hypothetical protein